MLSLENLAELFSKYKEAANASVAEFSIGGKLFAFNSKPAIMGVINLSPDSWYRESVCLTPERAIQRGSVLHAQGADIIDVGAESTLAQAGRVDAGDQSRKVLPIIRELNSAGIPVSIETYHTSVTEECLKAGADVVNLTGSEHNDAIFRKIAEHGAAVIICYVQGENVRAVGDFNLADDPTSIQYEYFARRVEMAAKWGLKKIFLDPGLGFYYRNLQDSAVRIRYQMTTFLNSFRLRTLGFPVCQALPHAFEHFGEEVRSAEAFFAVLAAIGKTDLFRTHEVPRIKAVLDTLETFKLK